LRSESVHHPHQILYQISSNFFSHTKIKFSHLFTQNNPSLNPNRIRKPATKHLHTFQSQVHTESSTYIFHRSTKSPDAKAEAEAEEEDFPLQKPAPITDHPIELDIKSSPSRRKKHGQNGFPHQSRSRPTASALSSSPFSSV
jgi:hypothetical protein